MNYRKLAIFVTTIIVIISVFMLSNVSSADFDNVKSYDAVKKEVTITNLFGLGSDLARVRLVNYTGHCTEGRCYLYYELQNLLPNALTLESSKYYDKTRTTEKPTKLSGFEIYDPTASYKVPIYETKCTSVFNTTTGHNNDVCTEVKKGDETRYGIHVPFNPTTKLDVGNYSLREKIDIRGGETLDVVPKFYGLDITDWAVISADYSQNITTTWGGNFAGTKFGGFEFTATVDGLSIIAVETHASSTPTTAYLQTQAGANLSTATFVGKWATFSPPYNLTNGNYYLIVVGSGGASYTQEYSDVITYPQAMETITWTRGVNCNGAFSTMDGCNVRGIDTRAGFIIPYLTVTYPTNTSYGTDRTELKYTIDADGVDCWYSLNGGITNSTSQACGLNWTGLTSVDGANVWTVYANSSSNLINSSKVWFDISPVGATLNITYPLNKSYNSILTELKYTVGDNGVDCWYSLNGGTTNSTSQVCGLNWTGLTSSVGTNTWRVYANSSSNLINSSSSTFYIDTTEPVVNITYPSNSTYYYSNLIPKISVNITASDTFALDSCWFWNNTGTNGSRVNCGVNLTYSGLSGVNHIIFYANDTSNNIASKEIYFNNYLFNYTHIAIPNVSIGEGGTVVFNLVLNRTGISTVYPNSNATLYFNSVAYTGTADTSNADWITFTKSLPIPSGTGNSTGKNISYLWDYQLRATTTPVFTGTTDTKGLNVYNVSLSDCAISGGQVILNMSLKDEETLELLNVTSPNTNSIELDLTVTSRINSTQIWEFYKIWANNQTVAICIPYEILNGTTYKIDFTVGFEGTSHVREFFFMENGTLDNSGMFNSYTSNTINLLDLASADSTTFLFTFTGADGLEIDDALVHTYRKYIGEGLFREAERSKQDNNGQTHVHLVEEDVIYYFMITQNGQIIYTSDTYNAKCLSSPCEVVLSSSSADINWSLIDNEGGQYAVSVNKDTRIVTTTFSLDSVSLVNISLYEIENGELVYLNGTSLSAMSGSLSLYVPIVYGNNSFFVSIYRDNVFIKSVWVDLVEGGKDYFGTFGAVLGALVVLTIMLMAVSEGAGFMVFTILALVIIGIMKLVDLGWASLIALICAGAIILYKLTKRRGKG